MTGITLRHPGKVIYQGDDADRLAELLRELAIAEARAKNPDGGARLGDVLPTVEEAQAALDAFVTEAAERAFAIKVQHIGSRRFRDLVLAHPPRMVDGEPDPENPDRPVKQVEHPDDGPPFHVNWETFPAALLLFRDDVTRTIVEPDLSDGELRRLVEVELSEGDVISLFGLAWGINTGESASPKDVAASVAIRTSSATSESPEA